jgi:hypothetical protein
MMHAIRHIEGLFIDGCRTLDQQQADAASIEKGDALIRQCGQEFAADDLGIKSCAPVDVAHRNAEMRDTLDLGHEFLTPQWGKRLCVVNTMFCPALAPARLITIDAARRALEIGSGNACYRKQNTGCKRYIDPLYDES